MYLILAFNTLFMIYEGTMLPQLSFKTINPSIDASPSDKIEIPTSVQPWEVDFRAALILPLCLGLKRHASDCPSIKCQSEGTGALI